MIKTVDYPIPPVGGLNRAYPAHFLQRHETPDCDAVWSRLGQLQRIPGKEKFCLSTVSSGSILKISTFLRETGDKDLVVIGLDRTYKYNTSTEHLDDIHDGTNFTGTQDSPFSTEHFFDGSGAEILVISNFVDAMRKWTGTSTISTLAGSPPKAKCLLSLRNYLLAGHTNESGTSYPRRVRWSALGNGEDWPVNNYVDLRNSNDWIISLNRHRDRGVIYKENGISLLDYVGGDDVFNLTENYITGIGPVSASAVIPYGRYHDVHYILSNDLTIYRFDGVSCDPKSDKIDQVIKTINATNKGRTVGLALPTYSKVMWAIPYADDEYPFTLLFFDIKDESWFVHWASAQAITALGSTLLEESYTWDTLPYDTWDEWDEPDGWDSRTLLANTPEILFGSNDGYLRKWLDGVDDDGTAIDSNYRYPWDNLDGSERTVKRVSAVVLQIENRGSGTFTFQAFVDHDETAPADLDDDGSTNKTINAYSDDEDQEYFYYRIDVDLIGRSFQWRIYDASSNWSMRVIEVEYGYVGRKVTQ